MTTEITDSDTWETDTAADPEASGEADSSAAGTDGSSDAIASRPAPRRARRVSALLMVATAFVIVSTFTGIPTDPVKIFLWIFAVEIAWNSHLPWRSHLGFLRDWIGVVILLVVYNFSRGFADDVATVHVTEMIHADKWLFGWATGDEIPSVWLQDHLYNAAHPQWYDVAISFVYFSHFLAAPAIAAVLWFRKRDVWTSFIRRWFTLFALGLATYFAYPAMPPWLASLNGYLPPVEHGVATRGWYALGMVHGGNLLTAAQLNSANVIAAMPSLHSAFALFICVFFMQRVRKRWWPLLIAYPLAMAFTLTYSGEHYVTDVLVGWSYVGLTYLLVAAVECGLRRRRASGADQAGTDEHANAAIGVPE